MIGMQRSARHAVQVREGVAARCFLAWPMAMARVGDQGDSEHQGFVSDLSYVSSVSSLELKTLSAIGSTAPWNS